MKTKRTHTDAMRRRRKRSPGFTVLELMVALMAGVTTITTVYMLSAASSRHFQEQQRIAQTQMALRMAIEQVRRDIGRAGFFGTPNSDSEQRCQAPTRRVAAIDGYTNDDETATGWLPNADENGVSADRILLTGNYASADGYLAVGLDSSGGEVFLQRTWQSFQRTFGPLASEAEEQAFEDVFREGRILHISTRQGNHFFVTITAANTATASVEFTPALGVGGSCVVGLADGAVVAPLSRIEYTVSDLTRDGSGEGDNLAPVEGAAEDDDMLGRTNSMLIRREVEFDNDATPIAGTTRPVLEYVADFNLDFVLDQQLATGLPPTLTTLTGVNAEAVVNANPNRVRSVMISLAARSAEQDVRFPWVAREDGAPLARYRVNPELPGAARVRQIRTEVLLPNVASRVLRP